MYQQQFYDIINECALYQCVNKPTRYRPGSQPHILDLLLTSEENKIDSVLYHFSLGSSNHLCLNFSVKCSLATRLSQNKIASYNFATYVCYRGDYSQ